MVDAFNEWVRNVFEDSLHRSVEVGFVTKTNAEMKDAAEERKRQKAERDSRKFISGLAFPEEEESLAETKEMELQEKFFFDVFILVEHQVCCSCSLPETCISPYEDYSLLPGMT
jgi:hypothetical protein